MKIKPKEYRLRTLRRKAEQLTKRKTFKAPVKFSEADALKLIHELEVHQIELEIQNEELEQAQKALKKAAEHKYMELYDFAPTGYITLSENADIVELNIAAATMLGKGRSELINNRFTLYVSDESKPIFNRFFDDVFKSGNKESCELVLHAKNKLPIWVYLYGTVSENSWQCFISVIDISALKNIENELLKAKEEAEKSNSLKTAFLSNMSHEIRTPMNGIIGFSDLLQEHNLSHDQLKSYIGIIQNSSARMLNIIDDIIDISKIESGVVEVRTRESNMNTQMEYIYTFFKPEVEAKGVRLHLKSTLPANEAVIKTDHDKVFAILTNLVKNAIKYTEKGSIEFGCVSSGGTDGKPVELEFFVKDTGIGIPRGRLESIFDRFTQIDVEGISDRKGVGLGLSISKSYVEMLGGKIWVESEEGVGSTFYFTLPYHTN